MNSKRPSSTVPTFKIIEPVNVGEEQEEEPQTVTTQKVEKSVLKKVIKPHIEQKDEKTQKDDPNTSKKQDKFKHCVTMSQSDKEIENKSLQKLIEMHKAYENESLADNVSGSSPGSDVSVTPHCVPSSDNVTPSTSNQLENENLKILRLTKMKWLSEDRSGEIDSSFSSATPSSDEGLNNQTAKDRLLSTIVRLDKECNLFGLSNFSMQKTKRSKKKKAHEKPVFAQTTIVQICCGHKSPTDLPTSLKCRPTPTCSNCFDPGCSGRCRPACCYKCCSTVCPPLKCGQDCSTCVGFTVMEKRRPLYEPTPIELTPRSSCIMSLV